LNFSARLIISKRECRSAAAAAASNENIYNESLVYPIVTNATMTIDSFDAWEVSDLCNIVCFAKSHWASIKQYHSVSGPFPINCISMSTSIELSKMRFGTAGVPHIFSVLCRLDHI